MNPWDFSGPAFLFFYVVLSILVILGIVVIRRTSESGPTPRIDLSDPLLIAYLRGGEPEAMRVATLSLIDRGLLICSVTRLQTAQKARAETVRRPLEKELLDKFVLGGEASSMFTDSKLQSACAPYEHTLRKFDLLPDGSTTLLRGVIFGFAFLILAGVGLSKLIIALERGRPNVCFLIVLMIVAIVIAAKQSFPRLTETGKAMLQDVKHLYSNLRERAYLIKPGGATIEPMMLAAVFGVGALAGDGFGYTRTLFPRATKHNSSSSCASSCGDTCGSSCGSSCGGGGCGGGCGGCGG